MREFPLNLVWLLFLLGLNTARARLGGFKIKIRLNFIKESPDKFAGPPNKFSKGIPFKFSLRSF